MKGRVLVIDDDSSMCELLVDFLQSRGYEASSRTLATEGLKVARSGAIDVVLTDLKMPGMNGVELCHRMAGDRPDIPVIMLTAFGSMDAAVQALRAGAYDFVTKPVELELLENTVRRATAHRRLSEEVKLLTRQTAATAQFKELVGDSPPMRQLFQLIERVADSEMSILITGESGVGKELVARAVHKRSRRRDQSFAAVNCTALPEALIESELFGHKRGAFTGARNDRKGLLLQADRGTLLLDEIGDLPLAIQPKLLRALEERIVRPVGGDHSVPFDVRMITATNRDLETAIEDGKFREDLYFRINMIQIHVPPLRARGMDVLTLAQRFIGFFSAQTQKSVVGLSKPAAERLVAYRWPGNVRELRNAMGHAVALTRFERITVGDLPSTIQNYRGRHLTIGTENPTELQTMENMQRRYLLHVLDIVGGNQTRAAQILGLDRKTLYRKLQAYKQPDPERERDE